MDKIICTCCMGAGVHERYNPNSDHWSSEDCTVCESKGYITQERSDELWKLSGLEATNANTRQQRAN